MNQVTKRKIKTMKTKHATAALGVATVMMTAATGFAADAEEDRWRFANAPILWFTGIEGDVTIRGMTADLDLGFDDLFDATEFGFSMYLEARKNKFGFYASPSYTKLEGDGRGRLVSAEFEQDFWIVEGGGFYNLIRTESERPLTVDAIAGVRYLNVTTELDLQGLGPGGAELELDSSTKLLDPVVGARAQKYLTKKVSLNFRGDIGGFGISEGDTSDLSWQAIGLVGYDLTDRFTVYGGYRGLGIDTSEGGGTDEKGFDLVMHGAMAGLQINW
jgi:opacity protein-like surface antigen